MKLEGFSYAKALAPRLVTKALQTFDRVTIVIVASCWGGALLLMVFALYTVHLSVSAKRDLIEAAAKEPILPKMVTKPPAATDIGPIVERMKKRFPDLTFATANDQSLTVSALEGSKFRTWLTVLSYIDTVSPQYRWQIKDLCVGMQCPGATPMKAVIVPQKITFSTPNVTEE